jgi:hypothetical protein
MKILDKAVKLERALINRFARRTDIVRHPLEVYHAILEEIEDATEAGPRGGRIFPYTAVTVTLAPPDAHWRATAEALFAEPPSFEERVRDRLREAGCADSAGVTATLKLVDRAEDSWRAREYHLDLRRQVARRPAPRDVKRAALPTEVQLAVIAGTAAKTRYSFTTAHINLGRLADVLDHQQRVTRQNHVAFTDDKDDISQSVSRTHAHITCDPVSHDARLHDDGSTHGTRIVRAGHTIHVPRGGRGVTLRDGDEMQLGQARLRVTLRPMRRPRDAR